MGLGTDKGRAGEGRGDGGGTTSTTAATCHMLDYRQGHRGGRRGTGRRRTSCIAVADPYQTQNRPADIGLFFIYVRSGTRAPTDGPPPT